MYRVRWDEETGGILLTDDPAEQLDGELRPVFHEELDLLGFQDGGWVYPREAGGPPLLWSVGRKYYYRGRPVADARGGGFFEKPELTFAERDILLEPVDLEEMTRRNVPLMSGLVFRALEFIRGEYGRWHDRVDITAVAFSSGKDSLALLDLVQRALPPDCFEVVFNDTTMELTSTYEAIESAKAWWPRLRFHTARSHMSAQESWHAFGPPSRLQRWCCSVHKSGPTLLLLRQLTGKQAVRAMLFEGVRSQESQTRADYGPVSVGGKHATQVNARPILAWSAAEVYSYIAHRHLSQNTGYRWGLSRIGCSVCPFGSPWSEAILYLRYQSEIEPFLDIVGEFASVSRSGSQVTEFVKSSGWKSRAGGKSLKGVSPKVLSSQEHNSLKYLLVHPNENWLDWLTSLGETSREDASRGQVTISDGAYRYEIQRHEGSSAITIQGIDPRDRSVIGLFDGIAYKTAYCVHCRACEVECPTGALRISRGVRIDETACSHCHSCITRIEKGCLAARSLQIAKGGGSMKGLDRYCTFGLRKQWVDEYFSLGDEWWGKAMIGPKQYTSARSWLADAEILEGGHLSALGTRLAAVGTDSDLFWAVVWTNWSVHSPLIRWFVSTVPAGSAIARDQLPDMMGQDTSERTRQNALQSLFQLFRHTPLGDRFALGHVEWSGTKVVSLQRPSGLKVPPLAILYALYRYAESESRYGMTLGEICEASSEGPAATFGLTEADVTPALTGLASNYPDWISVEFARDLDNIYLRQDRHSADVLLLSE